ncbi:hypothetical protein ACFYTG_41020 [Streptomyces mirabilis]|uniref:hypothetical protein n=1 Tax=Streptomyces mirabilis TaxID=68239 RepID=UPI0036CCD5BB
MADSGAVMGLIGAIGGALVGGAAGVYGPLLLKARERRQVEADRATERLALQEDRARELADEKLLTLSVARVRTRLWYDFLVQTVTRVSTGEPVDIQTFHTEGSRLAGEAMDICYGLARLRMAGADGGDPNGVLRALRNASEVVYTALRNEELTDAPTPAAVRDALDTAASARSWFRLTIDRLVEEQYRPN